VLTQGMPQLPQVTIWFVRQLHSVDLRSLQGNCQSPALGLALAIQAEHNRIYRHLVCTWPTRRHEVHPYSATGGEDKWTWKT
jgi:hypothetical protein